MHKRTKRKQKGRLGRGRNANIENHENRFADMETRESSGWNAGARASLPRESAPLAACHPSLAAADGIAGVDLSTTAQMQQSLQTFSAVSTMSMIV